MQAEQILDPKVVHRIPRLLRAAQRHFLLIGPRPPARTDLRVYRLRPWYHDFSALGVRTDFTDSPSLGERFANLIRRAIGKDIVTTTGTHLTQRFRDEHILPALERAFLLHRKRFGEPKSFLDVFSNDGFYAFWVAKHYNLTQITCVELNSEDVARGHVMVEVLGLPQVRFQCQNVYDMDDSHVDLAFCMGGLYHVTDPDLVVRKLHSKANMLVVHTVVTTESEDPSLIIAPAPGWRHGSRFTHAYLLATLQRAGWEVLEDECTLWPQPSDKHSAGASYALCAKRQDDRSQPRQQLPLGSSETN